MPTQDISRATSNVALPVEVSEEIWAKAIEQSAFMQLGTRVNIPGTGTNIQTITGEPQADWVAETGVKPVSFHTFGKKTLTPYKLAVIEPFSNEFLRDKKGLYAECVNRSWQEVRLHHHGHHRPRLWLRRSWHWRERRLDPSRHLQ